MQNLVNVHFPLKKITISDFDRPFFTEELRLLRRKRQRRYQKFGKDQNYKQINIEFQAKLKLAKSKYRDKIIQQLKEGKRGSTYSALKKLSLRTDQTNQNTFTLPSHQTKGLSAKQSANVIASYFANISSEFSPVSIRSMPQHIQDFLEHSSSVECPLLSEVDIYDAIRKAKKPNSSVG